MFDLFGEMTAEEINKTAEGLKNEGDTENVYALAKENGISKEFVEMYLQGDIPALCDAMTAAVGKLDVEMNEKEVKAYSSKIPAEPIVEYLKQKAMEDEAVAAKIREKGKSLAGCLKHVESEARKKVSREKPYLADAVVYRMARDYYMKEAAK